LFTLLSITANSIILKTFFALHSCFYYLKKSLSVF